MKKTKEARRIQEALEYKEIFDLVRKIRKFSSIEPDDTRYVTSDFILACRAFVKSYDG